MNLNQIEGNTKNWISLPLLLQLFLRYTYVLDISIHQYVCTIFSDGTLPILLNLWKPFDGSKLEWSYIKFIDKMVFQKFRKLAKWRQKILCSHTDESKHLAFRHILKTIEKVMEEKFKFFCFSSLPAIRRAGPPDDANIIVYIVSMCAWSAYDISAHIIHFNVYDFISSS